MTHKVRIGLCGLLLIVSLIWLGLCMSQAKAQTTEDFPPGEDQIVPLAPGDRVPFEGQLFSTDTAIRWGFRLQRLRLQLDQDVAREREICAAQNDLLTTKLNLQLENTNFQLQSLRDQLTAEHQTVLDLTSRLEEAEEPPWYETWAFGLVVGTVVTAGLIALSGWLVNEYA